MTLGEIRRRPTLPGRFQPSTISVLRLNFCVRDGNRWIPQAIVTGKEQGSRPSLPRSLAQSVGFRLPDCLQRFRSRLRTLKTAQVRFRFALSDQDLASLLTSTFFALPSLHASALASTFISCSASSKSSLLDQALDRLVSPSSIHCCTSTDDLSTLSSSRGLTCF